MGSLNVGILGHVDSGKTTFTKRLAEVASTSAFDKHADSGGRRNTLDLGFSSVRINETNIALVDCPGHAALIRAVLAASMVFDMAVVIIDARHGIQAQTAEHLLLCNVFCPMKVIVVLNKIDLLDNYEDEIEKIKKNIRKGLKIMGIPEDTPIVEMSLDDKFFKQQYIENLKKVMNEKLFKPCRKNDETFLMAVDHCFLIKGKGTVLTGTVTQGTLQIGEEIEFASLQETRKVKTIETWKVATNKIEAGERAAILVANFDPSRFSRTFISKPGYLKAISQCLCEIEPIQFFRSSLTSKTKMHISIGFETVMAECQFLRKFGEEFEQLDTMKPPCMVWLIFEKPIFVNSEFTFLMASRLDQNGKGCRFAFRGFIQKTLDKDEKLRRFTRKFRSGFVDRLEKNANTTICAGMFKPETNIDIFKNMQIVTEPYHKIGKIEGAFGKNGKFRVVFEDLQNIEEKMKINLFIKKYSDDNSLVSYVPDQ